MEALGESVPGYKLRAMIDEVDKDKNGFVEFDEFLEVGTLLTDDSVPLCLLDTFSRIRVSNLFRDVQWSNAESKMNKLDS